MRRKIKIRSSFEICANAAPLQLPSAAVSQLFSAFGVLTSAAVVGCGKAMRERMFANVCSYTAYCIHVRIVWKFDKLNQVWIVWKFSIVYCILYTRTYVRYGFNSSEKINYRNSWHWQKPLYIEWYINFRYYIVYAFSTMP